MIRPHYHHRLDLRCRESSTRYPRRLFSGLKGPGQHFPVVLVVRFSSQRRSQYFRGWLIAQGREYVEAALARAERAADRAGAKSLQCEEILGVAYEAYKQRTGEELPMPVVRRADILTGEPAGQRWDDEDLPRLYPELWERFGW
jgi:hypothetical protein